MYGKPMTEKKRDAGNLKLLGGRLCLDFTNTLDWRGTDTPVEFLNTFQDLVIWSLHAGVCTSQDSRKLSLMAKQSKMTAQKVQRRALELREIIYRIFSAISQNKNPSKKDLARFNQYLTGSMQASQIVRTRAGYAWNTTGDKARLDWILNPIVRSAAEVLVSDEIKNIKSCADAACGWLFLDISRNKRRRWCDMQDCGNRAKASRFYQKKQGRS
jgi:predicted RNA-binding Zn ribbon-like protein